MGEKKLAYRDGNSGILRAQRQLPCCWKDGRNSRQLRRLLFVSMVLESVGVEKYVLLLCCRGVCPVEHQGHWSGIIPPLVNVGLSVKYLFYQIYFNFIPFQIKNGGSSVPLLVYKKCNLLYFLPTVNLAPLCPCPSSMEMWLHYGRIHVKGCTLYFNGKKVDELTSYNGECITPFTKRCNSRNSLDCGNCHNNCYAHFLLMMDKNSHNSEAQ